MTLMVVLRHRRERQAEHKGARSARVQNRPQGKMMSSNSRTKERRQQKAFWRKAEAREPLSSRKSPSCFPPAFMILIVLLFSRNARGKTGVIGVAVRKFSESLAVEFFSDVFDAFVQLFGNLFPSHPVYVLVEEEP